MIAIGKDRAGIERRLATGRGVAPGFDQQHRARRLRRLRRADRLYAITGKCGQNRRNLPHDVEMAAAIGHSCNDCCRHGRVRLEIAEKDAVMRAIWQRLRLPLLTVKPPWYGDLLGDWTDAWESCARNAVAGEWAKNGENMFARRRRGLTPETPVRGGAPAQESGTV
jgi:hypothetical protein